jgi:pSer/pThr/pTyr-binding forkhead associated (FHA) protein
VANQEFQLTIRKGPKVGQAFRLDARSLIIGRDPMSDIIINDPEVSRQHARISETEDGFQIEDLGSTNGTFVEGQRLKSEPVPLKPGQSIGMGSGVRLVYEVIIESQREIDTLFDAVPSWPNEEADTPEQLETNPASDQQEESLPDADFLPPFASSAPRSDPFSAPESDQPLVPSGESKDNNRRNAIIVVTVILLLCCCCAFISIMYQWGGDFLLEYFGIVP